MKTKFYSFITGLLMAACMTSYGQEIVSNVNYSCGRAFSYNDLATCSDGSVISGIYCFDPYDYEVMEFHVCKFSPDGELLDSVTFASAWELYDIPDMPDIFVLPDYQMNESDSTLDIVMTFIDADLNIINTVTTPVLNNYDPEAFEVDAMCLSPRGDLIATFWLDEVFHLVRIGLNGTLKAFESAPGILPDNLTYTQPVDSALHYESFGVFDESPERFYKLGGYIGDYNEIWPIVAYIFDTKLQLTDTIVYCHLSDDTYCEYNSREHIVPLHDGTSTGTHVLAANIHASDGSYLTSLVKYDSDFNPITFTFMDPPSANYSLPINTIVTDNNQIYHTYQTFSNSYNNPIVCLAHLDEDLNIVWNIKLPQINNTLIYGATLKVLANGDIAVSMSSYQGPYTRLIVFIVRDDDPTGAKEISHKNTPFELYPNPVKDLLNLRFDDGAKPESVELYNLAGCLVTQKRNAFESIDMNAMSSGVYMLRVTMNNGTSYHEKILKE